jgi:hypothetical protein
MRDLLILGGIAIMSIAAWIATAGANDFEQGHVHGPGGRGGTHASGSGTHMKHDVRHPGSLGLAFLPETRQLFAGQPEPAPPAPGMLIGDLGIGGPDHLIPGHLVAPAIHPLTHLAVRFEGGEAVNPQPATPSAGDADQAGAATAQPDPTSSPLPPRPPGAAGPGRPVSGWSSPGLPGPGRPAIPQ